MAFDQKLCDERHDNIEQRLDSQDAKLDMIISNQADFHNKMFVDNGAKSYQSFRRFSESFMRVHLWVYGLVISGSILTGIGATVTWLIKK